MFFPPMLTPPKGRLPSEDEERIRKEVASGEHPVAKYLQEGIRRASENPVASGEPVPSGGCNGLRRGSHGDASTPKPPRNQANQATKGPKPPRNQAKACKEGSKKTKKTKQRLTKKEQDEAAIQQFLSSQAFNETLQMAVEVQIDKQMRSERCDRVYKRAHKVMRQFAFLANGNPEVYTEEGDLLLEYMGKMTELQCKREGMSWKDIQEIRELNAAFSNLKHKR